MKHILLILILVIVLASCSRKIDCRDPSINLAFISFPTNEIDTLVIRKFPKDNNFQNVIDTIEANISNASISSYGDTTYYSFYPPYDNLKPGYDWQLFIPATNRTISITNIIKEEKTGKCAAFLSGCSCKDDILSIHVDNRIAAFENYPRYALFIHR